MRITILTYGSQGDVQPCLALAVSLQRAGHTPLLALPAFFRTQANALGIPAVSLPGDIAQLSLGFNQAGKNPLAMMRAMQKNVEPVAIEVARTALLACQQADLVVHTFAFTLGAHAFARQLSIPDISVQFFPMFFASSSYPQLAFPELPLGALYNRLTHHMANHIFAWAQRAMYPRIRKAAPDFPPTLHWPFKQSAGRAATPLILAYSPALVPPEPDWGAHVQQTGFWFLDNSPSFQPPPELEEFLTAGPQPLCAGFGSMIHPNSYRLQRALLDGFRQAGQRAVILTGWDGWAAAEPGSDRLFLKSAPHDWLFPRCSAIIHHGGAGTTAAALRSGRPTVALPLAADQPFWARRVHTKGASPAPLDARALTAGQVATAVRQALESEPIRQHAAALGNAIRREDGLGKAIEIIHRFA
jgi:sterol 3beta-glucosyltransferase